MVAGVARQAAARSAQDWGAEHSRSLAALIGAGLSPSQSVEVLRQQYPEHGWCLATLARRLNQGRSLSGSLRGLNLYGRRALLLLEAAEPAGRLPEALRAIAVESEKQRRRLSRLKAQLWLPVGLLAIAALCGFGLEHYWRGQPVVAALAGAVLPVAGGWVLMALLLRLLQRDSCFWLSWGWRLGMRRLAVYRRFYDQQFLRQLYWPLEAGNAATDAITTASDLLVAKSYRQRVTAARHKLGHGAPLVETLGMQGLLLEPSHRSSLMSAEAAGSLAAAIDHQLGLEAELLDLYLEAFYQWLPRIYYLLALSLGLGIIN
ncbi:MAG: type II secretion system F family protein [Oceanospirillaceae bacterium]|nr:type II secretion system F family protein [Oceanospirillaceae bacterium]